MDPYNVDPDAFDPRINIDKFYRPGLKVQPMSFFSGPKSLNNTEGYMLHFVVLSCTTNPNSAHKTIQVTGANAWGSAKRTKFASTQVAYNRYWICGDLANPPECFAVITRSAVDTAKFLKLTNADCFIGSEFYIFEPSHTDSSVGNTILLSEADRAKPLIPARQYNRLCQTVSFMDEPRQSQTPNFFVLNKTTIELSRVGICPDTSCTGIQCDRQKSYKGCSCQFTSNTVSLVYTFDVTFHIPPELRKGDDFKVQNYRSLRTTQLFFEDFDDHATRVAPVEDGLSIFRHREFIKKMVQFININGGWTIIGWYQKGQILDSTSDTEKIDNDHFHLHLVSVFPTDYVSNIQKNKHYKKLQIKRRGNNASTVRESTPNVGTNTSPATDAHRGASDDSSAATNPGH